MAHQLFSPPLSQPTMASYKLNFTVASPARSTTFVEFSPNGRFLAVGDRDSSSLFILDRLAGFHPTISSTMPSSPTALVWEAAKAFYIGLGNGHFIYYQIDLGGRKLVKGAVNCIFHGVFPVTAIALDVESKTLVLSIGPEVFALRRIRTTSTFHSLMNWGSSGLTWLEVNSASSPTSQAASILKVTPEAQPPRSQDQSVLPLTTHSSLHFVARI